MLSDNEYAFLLEGIESKAIPTPKLLIKDHKKKTNDGYPTRLIIPATNFTATFLKLGYLGLKAILDKVEILYNKFMITNLYNLKRKLEKLNLEEDKITLASLDIENMYPQSGFH